VSVPRGSDHGLLALFDRRKQHSDCIIKSILVAIYNLEAVEVVVIGHHDCGMSCVNTDDNIRKAEATMDNLSGEELSQVEAKNERRRESIEAMRAEIKDENSAR